MTDRNQVKQSLIQDVIDSQATIRNLSRQLSDLSDSINPNFATWRDADHLDTLKLQLSQLLAASKTQLK